MREHAFTQGERVYEAAGAIKHLRTPPYPSTHNLGTCRMGASATRQRVQQLRPDARRSSNLFISDGSQFTTGGAENPTLTIVTLAIRQADQIARLMTAAHDLSRRRTLPRHAARRPPMCEYFVRRPTRSSTSSARAPLRIHGVLTSIRLENMVWDILAEMAEAGGTAPPTR